MVKPYSDARELTHIDRVFNTPSENETVRGYRVAAREPQQDAISTLNSLAFDARVELVFSTFRSVYGNRFTAGRSAQESIDFKRVWQPHVKAFDSSDIQRALDQVITRFSWPPTLMEFIHAVHGTRAGTTPLPTMDQAYQEACRHASAPRQAQWSHVAVYHAGRATGWYRLRSDSGAGVVRAFSIEYDKVIARLFDGDVLTLPSSADSAIDQHVEACAQTYQSAQAFIQDMVNHYGQQGISNEIINALFFYLTRPRGRLRDSMKAQAEMTIKSKGYAIQLPLPDEV